MLPVPSSFRLRLASLILLLLLVGVGPLYWYIDYTHARSLLEDRYHLLAERAQAVATVMGENLRERQREIVLLARSDLLQEEPLDSLEVNAAIRSLQAFYPYYSWVGVTDTAGIVQAASGNLLVGANVSERPWFIHGLQGPYVGDLHEAVLLAKLLPPDTPNNEPIRFIDFAAPILDNEGKIKGVLATHANWRWASDTINALFPPDRIASNIDLLLINQQNEVIYPEGSGTPRTAPANLQPRPPHPFDSKPEFYTWEDGTQYLTAVADVPEANPATPLHWRLVTRQSRANALDDIYALQKFVLLIAILMILSFAIFAWLLARQISRPLEQLARLARRIQQGEEVTQFKIKSSTREIRQLVTAIRSMTLALLSQRHALARTNQELEARVEERTSELARANRELRKLVRHDTLTGLPNRRAIDERLKADFERWTRDRTPYAVAVLDIDHFKQVNDMHGHAAGDEVLCQLAHCLRSQTRQIDLCGRQGGEEFLLVLAVRTLSEAVQVAEKLRAFVADTTFPSVGRLTISIGVAIAEPEDTHPETILQRADQHLYQAKQAGRNRVNPQLDATA